MHPLFHRLQAEAAVKTVAVRESLVFLQFILSLRGELCYNSMNIYGFAIWLKGD